MDVCAVSRSYAAGDDRYGSYSRGWMSWRGEREESGRLAIFLAFSKSGIDVASGGRLESSCAATDADTLSLTCSCHHYGGILMIGVRVSSNRLRHKFKM